MSVVSRGIRNAFRNLIRTGSLVVILGLSIGLALSMLVAYQAVSGKIRSVKSSVGNTVSVSPAGARGFEGGGTALTETQLASVAKLAHVSSTALTLSDRLTTSDTTLKSAVDAGSLGQRNANNSGQGSAGPSQNAALPAGGPAGTSSSGSPDTTRSFTPPVTVIGTTDAKNALGSSQGGGDFTLKSGRTLSAGETGNVAVIGSTLASKNNLKVGSTFTAHNATVTVVGIFDAGNTFSNNQVIMPLKAVQTLSGQAGAVTSATVTVDSVENVDSVTKAVSSKLGSAADVTNASEQAEQTVKPLQNIQTISLYSLVGAVIAGAVIILMTMIMIVRERRREIGVFKAIGASNLKVTGQFVAEAMTLTTMGAVVGTVIGTLASSPITKLLVSNSSSSSQPGMGPGGMGMGRGGFGRGLQNNLSTVHAVVGWDILLYGLGAALVIALVGSALASFFIAKIRPAEVMRAE